MRMIKILEGQQGILCHVDYVQVLRLHSRGMTSDFMLP